MSVSKYDIEVDLAAEGTSHRLMIDLVGSNKSVLDVGCSTGYLGRVLKAFGCTVSGVEYDAEAAKAAAENLDDVTVADLEATSLSDLYGDRRFEVIVFGDVLEHLRDPMPTLRQARGLLAPGGYVVISLPNISHGDVRMSLLLGRFPYSNVGLLDHTHLRFFTRESLRGFLSDAGFIATEVRTTKAPLFGTELGVRPDEIDDEVVRAIERDEDATTYQFVVSAIPDDASSLASSAAWEAAAARLDLAAARREIADLEQRLVEAGDREAQLAGQLAEERGASAELRVALAQVTQELDRVRAESERARLDLEDRLRGREEAAADLSALAADAEEMRLLRATKTYRARRWVLDRIGR